MHAQVVVPAPSAPATGVPPQQFYLRLTPPRPTFAKDMTEQERAQMQQHADYWAELFKGGKVLILGPVDDPKGLFGFMVVQCSEAEAHEMANGDPTVKSGLNKIDVMPMHVFMRKKD